MKPILSFGLAVSIVASSPSPLLAQCQGCEEPPGLICSDTTWDQPCYVVTSSILIGCDATLTIEPGVQVCFEPGLGITVGSSPPPLGFGPGTLVARGTEGEGLG